MSTQREKRAASGQATDGELLTHLLRHRAELIEIAGQHGGENLRLFGSALRGDDTPDSDVDLLLDYRPGTTLFDIVRMKRRMEEVLGRRVELVSARAVHRYYKRQIFAEARPL
jgi:predicted nucleotidyltransferase